MNHSIRNLWLQAWSLVLVEMSPQELGWLVRSRDHLTLLASRRVTMIVSRVRLVAGLFAILTPLWIIIDVIAFPSEIWIGLATARLAATLAFVAILVSLRQMHNMSDAYRALAMLLAVPTSFFLFSYYHMAQFQLHGFQQAFATGYAFLPFVMLAGLSVFPLTLLECAIFATPMLLIQIFAAAANLKIMEWPASVASFWLLLLISAVSCLAGLSQLAFMIVLVREAIRDGLTGCFSRQSGEELLELQYTIATRSNSPVSVAFVDLDHFKQVNDRFGHDAGDHVLKSAVALLQKNLRMGDMLVRWGGEEFILIMPNTTQEQAFAALERIHSGGLGKRPDGTPMTASIGIAERSADHIHSWKHLVEVADQRMYSAKQAGRNRIVSG
jgi:diguanylate cyclase (GGDEF)-like protein